MVLYEWMLNRQREAEFSARPLWTEISSWIRSNSLRKTQISTLPELDREENTSCWKGSAWLEMWQNTDKLVDHFSQLIMVSLIMINTSTAATSDFHFESVKPRVARQRRTRKLCTRLKPNFAGRKTRGVLQSVPFRKWWEKESKKEKMKKREEWNDVMKIAHPKESSLLEGAREANSGF